VIGGCGWLRLGNRTPTPRWRSSHHTRRPATSAPGRRSDPGHRPESGGLHARRSIGSAGLASPNSCRMWGSSGVSVGCVARSTCPTTHSEIAPNSCSCSNPARPKLKCPNGLAPHWHLGWGDPVPAANQNWVIAGFYEGWATGLEPATAWTIRDDGARFVSKGPTNPLQPLTFDRPGLLRANRSRGSTLVTQSDLLPSWLPTDGPRSSPVESCGFGYHSVPTTAEETAWTTASSKTGNDGEGRRPSRTRPLRATRTGRR
jgi:hypothetical protein